MVNTGTKQAAVKKKKTVKATLASLKKAKRKKAVAAKSNLNENSLVTC
tara:strand:- start:240087 stop:240230 length:144 start_codon:yes stop_codon:yes gene_type:complete